MPSYKHSGTLGDLLYGLCVIPKLGPGEFKIAMQNIEHCVSLYGYRPDEVDPAHKGRFTETDFEMLRPLLEYQSYITDVTQWRLGEPEPDVDLDKFRGVLFRGFEGNYVKAYHLTFNLPIGITDLMAPWIQAGTQFEAPIVVSRTFRYRCPNGNNVWKQIAQDLELENRAVFLGTEDEWKDFCEVTGRTIRYKPVNDFLEMANIINSCEQFLGNQSFGYALAMALGKPAVLETIKIKPLEYNECFFPRKNIVYF
jgi:hypothetical protein